MMSLKFKKTTLLIPLFFSLPAPAYAGDITDMEWSIIDHLVVTYFESGGSGLAECTAFNQKETPIGGGIGVFKGSIARVNIEVPKKYIRKSLKVSCKESE